MLTLAHADRDQAADDIVDPLVDLPRAVGPILEQEEDVVRCAAHPLGDEQPERDPRVRLDLLQAAPAGAAGPPPRGSARASRGRCGGSRRPSSARCRVPTAPASSTPYPTRLPTRGDSSAVGSSGISLRPCGWVALTVAPTYPLGHGRPGDLVGGRADDEPEVAGLERELVDVGARGGQADRADSGRGGDLIHRPDHRQDRAVDVGQRQQPVVDHEAALEQTVVVDELLQEIGHRRARPRHPPVGFQEAALTLPGQQRVTIVQLEQEVEPAARGLDGVEHPETRPAGPRRAVRRRAGSGW